MQEKTPKTLNWNSWPQPIVALSPMADMTDSAFCRTVRHIGAGEQNKLVVFREMVSAEAVVRGNEKTLGMTDIHPSERPLVQQIFGSDPDTMAEAVRIIQETHSPDGFDINMGCPVYKIVHNFNGAALMKEPDLATRIVKAMKAVSKVPVSVKIRTGWSDANDCLTFAPQMEQAGADLITIHGRTKTQGYTGSSDWNKIGEVKKLLSIPLLANGDIHRAEQVSEALSVTGADGVLIARGALGNPWIFKSIDSALRGEPIEVVSTEERIAVVTQHALWHIEQYGEGGLVSFRKHLAWYFKGIPGAKELRQELVHISTLSELTSLLSRFLITSSI